MKEKEARSCGTEAWQSLCLHMVTCCHRVGEPFQLRSLAFLQGLRLAGKFYGRGYQGFPFSSQPCVGLQLVEWEEQ